MAATYSFWASHAGRSTGKERSYHTVTDFDYYKRAGLLLYNEGRKNMFGIKEIDQGILSALMLSFNSGQLQQSQPEKYTVTRGSDPSEKKICHTTRQTIKTRSVSGKCSESRMDGKSR